MITRIKNLIDVYIYGLFNTLLTSYHGRKLWQKVWFLMLANTFFSVTANGSGQSLVISTPTLRQCLWNATAPCRYAAHLSKGSWYGMSNSFISRNDIYKALHWGLNIKYYFADTSIGIHWGYTERASFIDIDKECTDSLLIFWILEMIYPVFKAKSFVFNCII